MTTAANPKQIALELIEHLPDDATFEDIMYELYVCERIDRGLKEADEGNLIPNEQVMREAFEWLRSSGRRARA